MERFGVQPGQRVVIIWDSSTSAESQVKLVEEIQEMTGPSGRVALENIERLKLSAHPDSSCDAVLSGVGPTSAAVHPLEILAEMARILKPGGKLHLGEPISVSGKNSKLQTSQQLTSGLRLAGFTQITEVQNEDLTPEQLATIKLYLGYHGNEMIKVKVEAQKPSYEVGSSSQLKLSFAKKTNTDRPRLDPGAVTAWTLSANDMNDEDVDIIDSDELLDDDDLRKPDTASLRALGCGDVAGKKKKACKNCTCGLADELEVTSQSERRKPAATSACGNCYLGDAFRCASCPYMGMPAFQPGETIRLTRSTLADA
uniref:Anamorsin n=1 Tax=Callorhinchus milii TaxID=7868 RepID=K4FUY9_CALMI|nr:anamorsin [Callorhinchus milii]|eukprot:gi/632990007/ref/XP_007883953.1/ PREDICTED: anamorsin [Callorhinchus milii]